MFSIILVIFSTTETENDSFLPPKAFFTLSFISFTDTITKFPPKNAYNSPVSINTPTKGVTPISSLYKGLFGVSIHTPTKGVTNHVNLSNVCWMFQSTHPRRVWLYIRFCQGRSCRFQSTHPRRVWPSHPRAASSWGLFQSTHPRRVWLLGVCGLHCKVCFNPHTHEGCDRWSAKSPSPISSFNPHTHEGCDCGYSLN